MVQNKCTRMNFWWIEWARIWMIIKNDECHSINFDSNYFDVFDWLMSIDFDRKTFELIGNKCECHWSHELKDKFGFHVIHSHSNLFQFLFDFVLIFQIHHQQIIFNTIVKNLWLVNQREGTFPTCSPWPRLPPRQPDLWCAH